MRSKIKDLNPLCSLYSFLKDKSCCYDESVVVVVDDWKTCTVYSAFLWQCATVWCSDIFIGVAY